VKRAQNWQKMIDRFFGIPLVFALSLVYRLLRPLKQAQRPVNPSSLAVFCVAALGDLILLSAPLKSFKRDNPTCAITLYCGPDNKLLISLLDPDNQIFSEIYVLNPKNMLSNLRLIWGKKFQLVIDSGQWTRWSALMAFLTPAQWRVGFLTPKQRRHFLFDQVVAHSDRHHELENFQRLFSSWIRAEYLNPTVEKKPLNEGQEILRAICHLFPSGAQPHQKEWPPKYWLQLFQELRTQGYQVILTGAPTDRERLNHFFTKQDLEGIKDLVGRTTLAQTRDLLAGANLVISVNTGIMHLAAALDAPLVALHGPTNPKRWGPVSKESVVIQSDLDCSPCLNLGFDYGCPRSDCMKNITPEKVFAAIQKIRPSRG
jgi:heptosyltransferase I